MQNFRFNAYTNILFGKGEIKNLPDVVAPHGKTVLLAYGGGSIKRSGLYSQVLSLLKDFSVVELSGIDPNPRIGSVYRGAALCREHKVDVVLAVGGGSAIDCAKMIAAAACYEGDAWDLVVDGGKIKGALPLVSVLTLAATGSEMNGNAVISRPETNEKIGTYSWSLIPRSSICDPTYLYTLPPSQTAAGTADIMSHVIEDYFKREPGASVQDRIAEGLLKTCIQYCPVALKDPHNYTARANLMWASSLALNGLCKVGKPGTWTCHPIEHELSAYYDITHGVGLAILTPRWMRYILSDATVDKFVDYAKNVWNFSGNDKFALAHKAIDATDQFFTDCGIPMTLREVGIADETHFREMAESAVRMGLGDAYVPLDVEDVLEILHLCL